MNERRDSIRSAFERNAKAVELRPSLGQKTAVTTVRVVEGLRCEASEGRWTVVADASDKSGGGGAGPDPSLLCRAALGTCLAMGYVTWAAHRGVIFHSVEVELAADFDARGQYGLDDVRPGFSEIRYRVRIDSPAPAAEVERVVEEADAASIVRDIIANPVTLVRTLEVTHPD